MKLLDLIPWWAKTGIGLLAVLIVGTVMLLRAEGSMTLESCEHTTEVHHSKRHTRDVPITVCTGAFVADRGGAPREIEAKFYTSVAVGDVHRVVVDPVNIASENTELPAWYSFTLVVGGILLVWGLTGIPGALARRRAAAAPAQPPVQPAAW